MPPLAASGLSLPGLAALGVPDDFAAILGLAVTPTPEDSALERRAVRRLAALAACPDAERSARLAALSRTERLLLTRGAPDTVDEILALCDDVGPLDLVRDVERYDSARAFHLALFAERAYRAFDTRARSRVGSRGLEPWPSAGHRVVPLGSGCYSGRGLAVVGDGAVVLAFRGTQNLFDVHRDLDLSPVRSLGGATHGGFHKCAEDLRPEIIRLILREARAHGGSVRVAVTGHSLGGALAVLIARTLAARDDVDVRAVYTFGAPRMLDLAGAEAYAASAVGARTFRVVHRFDLVPSLGLELGPIVPFAHVGRLVYRAESGEVWVEPRAERVHADQGGLFGLLAKAARGEAVVPLADHAVAAYVKALFLESRAPSAQARPRVQRPGRAAT